VDAARPVRLGMRSELNAVMGYAFRPPPAAEAVGPMAYSIVWHYTAPETGTRGLTRYLGTGFMLVG
jgi:hypothetical protein